MTDGPPTWARLSDSELFQVWDAYGEFASFERTYDSGRWPSIREPSPSVTWDLARERPASPTGAWDFAVRPDDVNALLDDAFKSCVEREEWLYALDWQHPCYRFWPHRMTEPENKDSWVVPVFPDDDYDIFLAQDFSFGTFGHPWEASLCVWGERLLEAVEARNDNVLSSVLRRDGRML
ncbi:DUF2716 domain-containing protein [Spirillospora sp. CA-108201]